jgi:6-phosphogluconate dehydrogenase, C-terminal domain
MGNTRDRLSALRSCRSRPSRRIVHNGIEYGLMAAYAEGLNILKHVNVGKQGSLVDAETTPLHFQQYSPAPPLPSSCGRAGPAARGECAEDGIEPIEYRLKSPDHQAVPTLQAPDAAAGAPIYQRIPFGLSLWKRCISSI